MIIVFSGYNNRAVLAFLRTLEKHFLEYSIIASGEHDPLFLTSYAGKIKAVRKHSDLLLDEVVTIISSIKPIDQNALIAPTNEYLNRFCLKYSDVLKKLNCIIPLVDKDIYEIVSKFYSYNFFILDISQYDLAKAKGNLDAMDISDNLFIFKLN